MDEYIKRDNVLALAAPTPGCFNSMISSWDVVHMPAENVAPLDVYHQCAWERDTAMKQLEEHGIAFGFATPDVVEVVRCKDCKHWGNPYCVLCKTRVGASYRSKDMAYRKPDDFCSYGKRRDEQCLD